MDPTSIILAIASPPGRSLRGIVRMSGPGAIDVIGQSTSQRTATATKRPLSRRGAFPITLDLLPHPLPATLLRFPGPHSYTGEDSIELQLPGNPALLNRIIDALITRGRALNYDTRRAEPGEFTARAFFNGRISLTEAEGVAATIAARSDAELRAAHMLTGGRLGRMAETLADELATVLALVEAGIDFTDEEDVVAITRTDLIERCAHLRERINQLLDRAAGAEALHAIPTVVLVGEPNAGKSTLFNALLGHERAVVSPLAGTTRDVIAEPILIRTPHGAVEVMLVDLAGRDAALDAMNVQMQARAREAIGRADLVVRCVPMDHADNHADATNAAELIVRTKADLPGDDHASAAQDSAVAVSALTGMGLDALRGVLAQRLADRAVSVAADTLVLNARHFDALHRAEANLADAAAQAVPETGQHHRLRHPELVAAALRAALDDLGSLAGRITPDDILGRVFATFCIGK